MREIYCAVFKGNLYHIAVFVVTPAFDCDPLLAIRAEDNRLGERVGSVQDGTVTTADA